MNALLPDEIQLFNSKREDYSKSSLLQLQKVFRKYHPEEERNCMCTKVTRKVKYRQFYEWYDKTRG